MSIEIGLFSFDRYYFAGYLVCYVDILHIEIGSYRGSLLLIERSHNRWMFDFLWLGRLISIIKNKVRRKLE